MSLALNEFQKALYTRLAGQLSGVTVYDHVPQNTAQPYVVIGQITATPWDSKTNDGQEFTATIHVWEKAAGKKSANLKMQSIYTALHHQETNLTLSGFTVVLIRCEFSDIIEEPGEVTDQDHYYHGVQRYRALIANN